ncbi:hypothetical protein ACVWW1_003419 [Bradyrhizobium sp. JR3.5]
MVKMQGATQMSLAPNSGFVWGVSTSSFQIEGAACIDGRGDSIWDVYCREPGRVKNGDTGETACDHYHRYKEDVALMRDLGIDAYRFSISWPRVLPKGRGASNEAGLAFYDRLIDELLASGIEPWICLYHWDLPQALHELGGWQNRDIAGWFADYTALIARRYGDRVRRFATFNEPCVFTLFGYGFGWNAPGIADADALHRAIHHVNLSHGAALEVLRAAVPHASLGAIHNRQPCFPAGPNVDDAAAARHFTEYWNDAFPYPQFFASYPPALAKAIEPFQKPGDMALIAGPVDWFGLNHYSPHYIKADPNVIGGLLSVRRHRTCQEPQLDGQSSLRPFAIPCSTFIAASACRSTSRRTEPHPTTLPTAPATSKMLGGLPTCKPIPMPCRTRSQRVRMSVAILFGRCWTILNGPLAMISALAWFTSTSPRNGAYPKLRPDGTPASSRENEDLQFRKSAKILLKQ